MAKTDKPDKRELLIADILAAQRDITALAREHSMSADELSAWVTDPKNYRCLAGLCVLADIQTQLLLSRYRLLAASRLIRLATEDGEGDVARRACVDLLRLDLRKADAPDASNDDAADDDRSVRDLLYGLTGADDAGTDNSKRDNSKTGNTTEGA